MFIPAALFTGLVLAASVAATPDSYTDKPQYSQWAPLSPPSSSGPVTITAGGTYSGTWASTSSTPAVRISTTEPVVIQNSIITNQSGGPLVVTDWPLAANVTLRKVKAFGGNGRFFEAEGFKSIRIENCTIDKTSGIKLVHGEASSSVVITRNKHRNIQRGDGHFGNFVQFAAVQNATIDVSWNEIINEFGKSEPEDLVSIYKSAHVRLRDNYFQGQYAPNNQPPSSQNAITLEVGEGLPPSTFNNEIWNNQVVDAIGGVAMFDGTRDNFAHHNRVVQDGKLPGGTPMGVGWLGMYIAASSTNNRMRNNVVGFVNNYGRRNDMWFPGAPGDHALNRSKRGKITRATEQAEWKAWLAKVAANRIRIGA